MLIRKFKKPRLLIVGCGDIGTRVAAITQSRFRVIALTSSPDRVPALRKMGLVPLTGNLDEIASLWRLPGLARWVLMLAPPPQVGPQDLRSFHLSVILRRGMIGAGQPPRLVYASSTGVYGDCAGATVHETRPVNPQTDRSRRRLDAEKTWRTAGKSNRLQVSILRVPGIYDARARSPARRLLAGMKLLRSQEDAYTNHIHADDLARVAVFALFRASANRIYNASDDQPMKVGEYFEMAARVYGLPPPIRLTGEDVQGEGGRSVASNFTAESRMLDNARVRYELGVPLHYPSAKTGLVPPAES